MTRDAAYLFVFAALVLAMAAVQHIDEDTQMILGFAVMVGACGFGLAYIVWWIFEGDDAQ